MTAPRHDVAAYVWPAYQPEPRWAELGLFPDGDGEWQNVREAVSKRPGHRQPRVPLWGYENEADPAVAARKIDAALAHGVNVFAYDWYWYGGRPFLEEALDRGFLGAPNNGAMRFFLMWANHHVNWLWDNRAADKRWEAPRWRGWLGPEEFRAVSRRWIERYFTRPNYYRIGGKPVLMIYEAGTFVEGMGGLPAAAAALARFRADCEEAGLGGVYILACDWGLDAALVAALGIDGATMYNFVHWASPERFPRYADWAAEAARHFDAARAALGLRAYFPHVSVGWDTNPRYPASCFTPTVAEATPAELETALRRARDWCDANIPAGSPRLITLNSWNEWTEGSYLEPDTVLGTAYLDAVARVFG